VVCNSVGLLTGVSVCSTPGHGERSHLDLRELDMTLT